MSREKKL